jgi:hypothetical protein
VILRPLYQSHTPICVILAEENCVLVRTKILFESAQVTFPMLLLRNSVVLATENKLKADKLMLTWNDLFSKQSSLINTKKLSNFPLDLDL